MVFRENAAPNIAENSRIRTLRLLLQELGTRAGASFSKVAG
jgi:hypothetical protein